LEFVSDASVLKPTGIETTRNTTKRRFADSRRNILRIAPVVALPMVLVATVTLLAQSVSQPASQPVSNLRIDSRAVLLDVLVTDSKGVPVTGLAKEAFTIREQGKAQTVSYFEEHKGASAPEPEKLAVPERQGEQEKQSGQEHLPPNTFSNTSARPGPKSDIAAVGNVLLLDTLNTQMADQIAVRKAAVAYLKELKPGSRLAIYTLGMRLRYVQGFSDDPALLAAALGYNKVGIPEAPTLLHESGSVAAFQSFVADAGEAELADRVYRTLEGLKGVEGDGCATGQIAGPEEPDLVGGLVSAGSEWHFRRTDGRWKFAR
jgi:hypothetical protein